jgi:thiamine biosynthesis protein ThiI
VREIQESSHPSQIGVILKRMMLRAASALAKKLDVPALVTGEAVAQVSSQTLVNLSVIDRAIDTLVLRPLALMHKPDIINMSRAIGTEVFAKNIPEYCGVISKKPTTRAKIDRIEHQESQFNFGVLETAIANSVSSNIDEITLNINEDHTIRVLQTVPAGAIVLDIRHPDEEERKPLALQTITVQKLPFYQLHNRYIELDKEIEYLLYCERGVMSRLQAGFLLGQGFAQVGVFQQNSTR